MRVTRGRAAFTFPSVDIDLILNVGRVYLTAAGSHELVGHVSLRVESLGREYGWGELLPRSLRRERR